METQKKVIMKIELMSTNENRDIRIGISEIKDRMDVEGASMKGILMRKEGVIRKNHMRLKNRGT